MAKNLMSVFGAQNEQTPVANAPATNADADFVASEARATAPRSLMTLGKTLFFKGELSADEDLLLLGRVEGSINHTASLTVGVGGVVVGDLRARTVTIKGTVEGDIEGSEFVVLAPTANVLGDIVAPRVSIVEGARFNGAVKMPPIAVTIKATAPPPASPEQEITLDDAAAEQMLTER